MFMKTLITLYRQSFEVSDEISDTTALLHILILGIFFFILGFTVSQIIIFLAT